MSAAMSSDLTFITNESGKSLRDRFGVLLGDDTRLFDCLVGYFFISGFHKLHPALTKTEKIRILIGIKTDGATYELIQTAKEQQEFILESHAQVRERVPGEILGELQISGDSADMEDGVRKFVEWIKSGKLEIRAYPSERLHAKLYIMTFHEGDRDKGRVITGSSNFTEAGLQNNLEFNVEQCWSPEQIATRLQAAYPDDPTMRISHETIDTSLYVLPRGALKRELLRALRHRRTHRRTHRQTGGGGGAGGRKL